MLKLIFIISLMGYLIPTFAGPKPEYPICDAKERARFCIEYVGLNYLTVLKALESACKIKRGVMADKSSCPTENSTGKCLISSGTADAYTIYYYSRDEKKAQSDCFDSTSDLHRGDSGRWKN